MRNFIILCAITLLFTACKESELSNSFIYFNEAQPQNVNTITSFPKKYIQTYSLDYSHRLVIEPNCIFINEIETVTTLKSALDSIPKFELRNNQVFDISENKSYKTFIKADTITFEIEHLDTIFSFAEDEIAKEYKSALILNKKVGDKYQTSIIKLSSIGMRHIQIGTKKDFTQLNNELKIPFQTLMEENDTLHVVLNPSRAHFRKLLRKSEFEYESTYLFR